MSKEMIPTPLETLSFIIRHLTNSATILSLICENAQKHGEDERFREHCLEALADQVKTIKDVTFNGGCDVFVSRLDGDLPVAPLNAPPEADAGPDQTVAQESCEGTEVTLDGFALTDPDFTPGTNDDIVFFEWYEDGTLLGSGEAVNFTFPRGTHNVTLVVTDSFGETDEDEVAIIVEDTTAPEVSVSVSKDSLWPPNHKVVDVGLSYEVSDSCEPEADASIQVTSD
jgi:hypothetical protein